MGNANSLAGAAELDTSSAGLSLLSKAQDCYRSAIALQEDALVSFTLHCMLCSFAYDSGPHSKPCMLALTR